ncbi:hypothetical protein QCA50_007398 [Cerrena zonata]|uniref:Phosducin domain-containing protein n=1 Tax=Cerrena zonata TaxID=2478898 RepID=A0AAW0G9X1_9APHY
MNGDIEDLVLSGKLFNPPSRSSSPVRSRSPSPTLAQWPTEDSGYDYDSDAERRKAIERNVGADAQQESVGVGVPGRTGVKGVIRDSREAAATARAKRNDEIRAMNRAMEKASLGGKTWGEEERERLTRKAFEEGRPEPMDQTARRGRFGHLREVGMRGYVQAVESEERNIWVVVHIYDPSLDRCAALDETLSRLARQYPSVKFLRARAGALGFASKTSTNGHAQRLSRQPFTLTRTPSRKILVPGRYHDEDDSEEEDDDNSDSEKDDGWDDDSVDTDVLPTMLVYRGGELVHSWVRVDWEAQMGVEELLRRHHVLSEPGFSSSSNGNCGLSSDEEDYDDGELIFGGSDDGV